MCVYIILPYGWDGWVTAGMVIAYTKHVFEVLHTAIVLNQLEVNEFYDIMKNVNKPLVFTERG